MVGGSLRLLQLLPSLKLIVMILAIDTRNTQIRDHAISWLGTGTSLKSGGVKLVSGPKITLSVKWCDDASVFYI
jgi:hypothetical protein